MCPLSSVEVTVTIRRGLTARDTWAGKMSLIDLKRCNSIESICEKRERERERERKRHTDTQTHRQTQRLLEWSRYHTVHRLEMRLLVEPATVVRV